MTRLDINEDHPGQTESVGGGSEKQSGNASIIYVRNNERVAVGMERAGQLGGRFRR